MGQNNFDKKNRNFKTLIIMNGPLISDYSMAYRREGRGIVPLAQKNRKLEIEKFAMKGNDIHLQCR